MTMTTSKMTGTSTWGRNIVIVYSIFAVSTLAFVAYAMTQRVDLTSHDYYEQALRHDSTQMALRRAADAGVLMNLRDSIVIALPAGMTIETTMTIELTRADDPSLDRRLNASVSDAGVIAIPVAGMKHGRWHLMASWRSGGLEYRVSDQMTVGR